MIARKNGVAAFGRPLAEPSPTSGQRLARDAAEAAEVRAYQTDPDVIALRVERVRAQVDRLCWAGIVLHSVPPLLVFTAAEAVTDLRDELTEAGNVVLGEATRARKPHSRGSERNGNRCDASCSPTTSPKHGRHGGRAW